MEEKTLSLTHQDFVLDICLDHYGQRLVTCSADGKVNLFKRTQAQAGWELVMTIWKAPSEVVKIAWSHPEFSMLLACCTNRSLRIFEEKSDTEWRLLHSKEDYKSDICGLEFGPKHLGLRLALCTADGTVDVYSPTDALREEWVRRHTFSDADGKTDNRMDSSLSSCLSWNTYPFDSRSMVVAYGNEAHIWRMDRERRKWRTAASGLNHNSIINQVAWAPNMGRSFHMIASASSDRTANIWSVRAQNGTENESVLGAGPLEVRLLQTLRLEGEVYRVEWNLTATTLATSSDDGTVRLWTPDLKGHWECQKEISDDVE